MSAAATAVAAAPVGSILVERMTAAERARAARVDAVLPLLREAAAAADGAGEFHRPHVAAFRDAGLLGLIIPESHGGLGGTLRDLAAATFALGTACPSTALAFFFHCSGASRGLLPLEALDAGRFTADEAPVVRAFADKLLRRMGSGRWVANFASESTKTEGGAITISAEATPAPGGWRLSGTKSYGCATGVADDYLVTARIAGVDGVDGIGLFLVPREGTAGVGERARWDALGMRATATHGIVLDQAFVPTEDALAVPGGFRRMMEMSRGSFVGNQLAATAVYAGAAWSVFRHTVDRLSRETFADTGRPIGTSPMQQELLGHMAVDVETALLWLRRQLELETAEPPLMPKPVVVQQWRLCKGEVCEAAFRVGTAALKAGGTGGTGNHGPLARAVRDLAMGLVQAFPAERGRLEVAAQLVGERAQALFGRGPGAAGPGAA
jgi:alkylation response protein AidB-like acyl-CoA dehydrogenase